ncbi:MAG: trypsin-like serine protease [Myxococcota bacterium]
MNQGLKRRLVASPIARRVSAAIALACALPLAACSSDHSPGGSSACSRQSLSGGALAGPNEYEFVLKVDVSGPVACTGVVVADDMILLAAHCLADVDLTKVSVSLRRGTFGDECAFVGSDCTPKPARAFVNQEADLAVLEVDAKIAAPSAGFPQILVNGHFASFQFAAFGNGDYYADEYVCATTYGEHLTHAEFRVDWQDDVRFAAFAAQSGPAVCSGDSGGPALLMREESTLVVGLLSESAAAPNSECTPRDGIQRWTRVGANIDWIESMTRTCSRATTPDGYLIADCALTN